MKRLFDIFVSTLVLMLFLPIGILISVAILIESPGGIFFRQIRIGKDGAAFHLFKFRSMYVNTGKRGNLTVGMNDSRITKVGLFIRKYKLDEFPQFLNVLRGEMSIVGPRPEVKEYVSLYTAEQRKVLQVKPGITDYASLEYFDESRLLGESLNPKETYIRDIMPAKLKLNQKYLDNPGLLQDLKIMYLTFCKMLKS